MRQIYYCSKNSTKIIELAQSFPMNGDGEFISKFDPKFNLK